MNIIDMKLFGLKYEDLADFEINWEVAKAYIGKRIACDYQNETVIQQIGLGHDSTSAILDYCNNPSDAWAIIAENRIDIEWSEPELGSIGLCAKYLSGDTDIQLEFTDNSKALRSAMVVFLMMKEQSK